MSSPSKPVLGYWNIRGLAHPLRLMLAYGKIDYEDKLYAVTPAPEFSREAWLKEKFTLDLDFPNLPYYIDNDVKLSQSTAITRYIAAKAKLLADSPVAQARCDMLYDQVRDFWWEFTRLCYMNWNEENKEKYLQGQPDKMKAISAYLGDRKWVAGDKMTFADFWLHEYLDQQTAFHPSSLDAFQNLKVFKARFEEIPEIKAYRANPKYIDRPYNNIMAKWF